MKRSSEQFLVTTAIEKTWPDDGSSILFIGEWCKLYSRKSVWQDLDYDVFEYHWNDRKKLHQDYIYINGVYENILKMLASQLNQYHNVNYSKKYWRILLGPWLGYFIQILFDRWFLVESLSKRESLELKYIPLKCPLENYVPNTMKDFVKFIETDIWNQLVFQELLLSNERFKPQQETDTQIDFPSTYSEYSFKDTLRFFFNGVSKFIFKKSDVFIISSYLSISDIFKLQLKLRQFPTLWFRVKPPANNLTLNRTNFSKLKLDKKHGGDKFYELLSVMVPRHLPKCYIEGYESLKLSSRKIYPKEAKKIFDRNSWNTDDVTKIWIAEKVENGCKYFVGQHGGTYGSALWNFTEEHQVAISDKFISWGWTYKQKSNVVPLGNIGAISKISKNYHSRANAMLVEMAVPRFSYHMYSVVVSACQYNKYFEDQIRFVDALPKKIQEKLLVKLCTEDYDLNQASRWHDRKPSIRVYNGKKPMLKMLKKFRLSITSYNATAYLETLSKNFPTIIFWNPDHWELRESAKPHFQLLKNVGIFHETPESAAKQMELVWDNVDIWWQDTETQSARLNFCQNYINTQKDMHRSYSSIFN